MSKSRATRRHGRDARPGRRISRDLTKITTVVAYRRRLVFDCDPRGLLIIDNSISRPVEYHWKAIVNQPRFHKRRRNAFVITKEPSEKTWTIHTLERHQYRNLIFFFFARTIPKRIFLPLVRLRVTNALTLFPYLLVSFWSEYPKTNKFYQYVYI